MPLALQLCCAVGQILLDLHDSTLRLLLRCYKEVGGVDAQVIQCPLALSRDRVDDGDPINLVIP